MTTDNHGPRIETRTRTDHLDLGTCLAAYSTVSLLLVLCGAAMQIALVS